MQTWKIVLAFIALSAAALLAFVNRGSNTTTGVAAIHTRAPRAMPVRPADDPDSEPGWGPFRRTDW